MIYGVNENFVVNGEFTPKQANQDMWSESQIEGDGKDSLPNKQIKICGVNRSSIVMAIVHSQTTNQDL